MNDYIRLTEPPQWCISYPTCSACAVDLETEGDGWNCPVCGTQWDMRANDGDRGTLYADWSGEEPEGPSAEAGDAWRWGNYYEDLGRHRRHPTLWPMPERPCVKEGA